MKRTLGAILDTIKKDVVLLVSNKNGLPVKEIDEDLLTKNSTYLDLYRTVESKHKAHISARYNSDIGGATDTFLSLIKRKISSFVRNN